MIIWLILQIYNYASVTAKVIIIRAKHKTVNSYKEIPH